ncbi:transcriptional regulator [Arthrobacter sp. MYb227]|uniref:LCP family protein n=1 Tax=Arthrobacter sp. MYb227 TaxID=1848601 RepID=UPI000CFAF74F|nr:LCP family protein [Arthrobacter sp. MYb227]PQZ92253.1 transcriptional regulator [Arthrobacter sp. MYb227]
MTRKKKFHGGYTPRRLQPPKKSTGMIVLFSAVAVVLIAVLSAGGYLMSLANTFDKKTQTIESAFPDENLRPVKNPEDGSLNFLLLGVDSGADGTQASDMLSGGGTDQRSDSMMLMHIPANRQGVYVMSIMRDLWTEIPGYGKHKINASMAFGGVPLAVQTIEGMFDTKIDHVAMIDFDGFKELSTALGGVTVQNDIEFWSTDKKKYHYPVGELNLQGNKALRFVRERKPFIDGDYQRVRNQQTFVKAAISELLSKNTLTNPATVYEVIDKVAPYLSFDNGFDSASAAGLALQMKSLRAGNVEMFTLPTDGTGTSPDGQSIILRNEQAILDIGAALRSDTFSSYVANTTFSH